MHAKAIAFLLVTVFICMSAAPAFALLQTGDSLDDVNYTFDPIRVQEAKDTFQFMRAFNEYFYLLLEANSSRLPSLSQAWNDRGWCAGDAHAENFGVLLLANGSSLFTINDVDDGGPCPVVLDLYRLMVGDRLYDAGVDLEALRQAYLDGLSGMTDQPPIAVQRMLDKSQKKGMDADGVSGQRLDRDAQAREISPAEWTSLEQVLTKTAFTSRPKLIDAFATTKIGGGSSGVPRYEVLLVNAGLLVHLELKAEDRPAITPVSPQQPDVASRIQQTLRYEMSDAAPSFYSTVELNNQIWLVRPRFAGNVGVNLDKNSIWENRDLMIYEAYALGKLHQKSVVSSDMLAVDIQSAGATFWENDVNKMVEHLRSKAQSLGIP